MNVLMSIRKPWTDMILSGKKSIEFRNNIGKEFKIGSIVYLYESKNNYGKGKVVGEFKIKDIVNFESHSKVGTYPLLPYYVENILKDEEILAEVKKVYNIELENYNDSLKLYYIFNSKYLEELKNTDKTPDLLSMPEFERKKYFADQDRCRELCNNCDKWLKSIGYYNNYGETHYKNYIEIDNYEKYDTPLSLSGFKNQNGKEITKAPMSWCYVQ